DVEINAGGGNVKPSANDGAALGVAGTAWSDLFLADAGVINWDSGDMTITNAANELQVDGGDWVMESTNKIGFGGAPSTDYIQKDTDIKIVAAADVSIQAGGGNVKPSADDGAALGVSGTGWSDLFLADGGVINWNAGGATITYNSATATDVIAIGAANTRMDAGYNMEFGAATRYIGDGTDQGGDFGASDVVVKSAAQIATVAGTNNVVAFGAGGQMEILDGSAGTSFWIISGSGGNSILSSSVGDMNLNANGGDFSFQHQGTQGLKLDLSSQAGDCKFLDAGSTEIFQINGGADSLRMASGKKVEFGGTASSVSGDGTDVTLTSTGNVNITSSVNEADGILINTTTGTSSTLTVKNTAGTGVAALKLQAVAGGVNVLGGTANNASIDIDGGNGGVTLQGGDQNDSILFSTCPLELSPITAPTTTPNKLYNVLGALYWNGVVITSGSASLVPTRNVYNVSSSIAAGTAVAIHVDVSGIADTNRYNGVDIFVNGQLMVSGSEAARAAGTVDYNLLDANHAPASDDTQADVKFAFAVENGDVVQTIVK
ncbi:hypothetical protein CL622_01590, partial [archaeon]|nr:hypothetical protein [archaeon]